MDGRRFVLAMLGTTLLAWAVWAAPIVWTDPYGALRARGVPTSDWPTRTWTRVAAAERLTDPSCDVVLLGTSQVVFLYGTVPFEGSGLTFCNAALGGGTMRELRHAADLLIAEGTARRVVLFLDLLLFHDGRTLREDFRMSRLNPDRTRLSYLLWTASSWDAFVEAAHARGVTSPLLPTDHITPTPQVAVHVSTKGFLHRPDLLRSFYAVDDRFDDLEATLDALQAADIEVLAALPPIHAIHHENYRTTGRWALYEGWKVRLAEVLAARGIPAWDFQRYHDPATSRVPFGRHDALNPWWFDAVHPTEAMGRAVLGRLGDALTDTPGDWDADFGVPFTPASVAEDLASREAERADWMRARPDQIAAYRRLMGTVLQEHPGLDAEWDADAEALGQTVDRLTPLTPVPAEGPGPSRPRAGRPRSR